MNKLQTFIEKLGPGCFLTVGQMPELIALDRLCPVLVRCGCVRFTCGAQYVADMLRIIRAEGTDYVRDVSLPTSVIDRADNWQPEPVYAPFRRELCHDKPIPAPAPANRGQAPVWDESQCGGVYDGHGVTSEADPGL